jgi:hypothetical protein
VLAQGIAVPTGWETTLLRWIGEWRRR